MKDNLKLILSDKIIKYASIASLILFFVTTVLIVLIQSHLPPYIPFFNSMPWGTDRLFFSQAVLFFPLIFAFVFVLNYICSALFYSVHPLIARILSFNAALFLFLGFLAYLQIVLLVL